MRKIKILSEKEAQLYTKHFIKKETVIISIYAMNNEKPEFDLDNELIKDIFYLEINDLERDYKIKGKIYRAPIQEDFIGLKEFIDKYSKYDILIHCHAGISRSAGVGVAVSRYLGLNEDWIWNSGRYLPNNLVLKLAMKEFDMENFDKIVEYQEELEIEF